MGRTAYGGIFSWSSRKTGRATDTTSQDKPRLWNSCAVVHRLEGSCGLYQLALSPTISVIYLEGVEDHMHSPGLALWSSMLNLPIARSFGKRLVSVRRFESSLEYMMNFSSLTALLATRRSIDSQSIPPSFISPRV